MKKYRELFKKYNAKSNYMQQLSYYCPFCGHTNKIIKGDYKICDWCGRNFKKDEKYNVAYQSAKRRLEQYYKKFFKNEKQSGISL